MTKFHIVKNAATGEITQVAFTAEEEAAASAPPPVDVTYPPLEAWKFWAVVEIAGLTTALNAAIDAIPDASAKAVAKAKLQRTEKYFRSDALFASEFLLAQLSMTSEQIDALWTQAHQLS